MALKWQWTAHDSTMAIDSRKNWQADTKQAKSSKDIWDKMRKTDFESNFNSIPQWT